MRNITVCVYALLLMSGTLGQQYTRRSDVALHTYYTSGTSASAIACVAACNTDNNCDIASYVPDTQRCSFGNSDFNIIADSPGAMVYTTGPCDLGWTPVGGRCLLFVSTRTSWPQSQAHCQSLGATLAHVDSQQDLNDVIAFIPCAWGSAGCGPWLGMNDRAVEGQLVGGAGQSVGAEILAILSSYNTGSRDCSYYTTNYNQLYIDSCDYNDSSICEKQPL